MNDRFDSLKAIGAGIVAFLLAKWLTLWLGGALNTQGIPTTGELTAELLCGPISAAIGGFVTAVLSSKKPFLHSLIAGTLVMALITFQSRHQLFQDALSDAIKLMVLCSAPFAVGVATGVLSRNRLRQSANEETD
ncbi:MAG TPA: hypothetical protein VN612_16520 [Acidobacteriaceae bacterium]|nr:hypothetical protein [Acidobacteriaceae bacterium]